MNFLKKWFVIIALAFPLINCTTTSSGGKANGDQENLRKLSSEKEPRPEVSDLRAQQLRDTALSVGARGGLAWRGRAINQNLLLYEKLLGRIFNFHGMLLDNNVLPPVLIEGRKSLNLAGFDVIRIADRNYEILQQAKFVTATPNWRNYLWMGYSDPESPDKSLLPKSKAEKSIWAKYIDEGWDAGILQAELIFKENLNRIKRDYEGMVLYRKLLTQNMVSPPYVATLDLGITGDGSNMAVNDRVLRITAFPKLKANGEQWKTEIHPRN